MSGCCCRWLPHQLDMFSHVKRSLRMMRKPPAISPEHGGERKIKKNPLSDAGYHIIMTIDVGSIVSHLPNAELLVRIVPIFARRRRFKHTAFRHPSWDSNRRRSAGVGRGQTCDYWDCSTIPYATWTCLPSLDSSCFPLSIQPKITDIVPEFTELLAHVYLQLFPSSTSEG